MLLIWKKLLSSLADECGKTNKPHMNYDRRSNFVLLFPSSTEIKSFQKTDADWLTLLCLFDIWKISPLTLWCIELFLFYQCWKMYYKIPIKYKFLFVEKASAGFITFNTAIMLLFQRQLSFSFVSTILIESSWSRIEAAFPCPGLVKFPTAHHIYHQGSYLSASCVKIHHWDQCLIVSESALLHPAKIDQEKMVILQPFVFEFLLIPHFHFFLKWRICTIVLCFFRILSHSYLVQ